MKDSILQNGNPFLRGLAKAVSKKDLGGSKLKQIIQKMNKALAPEENGVAIAAPQIGVALRIFIVAGKVFEEDTLGKKEKKPLDMVFINPELIRTSRKKKDVSEGCLSVRGIYGMVERHEKATVKALNEKGEQLIYHGSGLLAQIFQHEIDHLNGILFVDKAKKIDDEKL